MSLNMSLIWAFFLSFYPINFHKCPHSRIRIFQPPAPRSVGRCFWRPGGLGWPSFHQLVGCTNPSQKVLVRTSHWISSMEKTSIAHVCCWKAETGWNHQNAQGARALCVACSSSWSPWHPPASKRGENLADHNTWNKKRSASLSWGIMIYCSHLESGNIDIVSLATFSYILPLGNQQLESWTQFWLTLGWSSLTHVALPWVPCQLTWGWIFTSSWERLFEPGPNAPGTRGQVPSGYLT